MIKISKRLNSKVWLAIVLFFVIFNPPIVKNISFTIIAIIISFVLYFTNRSYILETVITKGLKNAYAHLALLIGYVLCVGIMNIIVQSYASQVIASIFKDVILLISLFLVSVALVMVAKKRGLAFEDYLDSLIMCGLFESFFCITSYLFPSVRMILNTTMANNTRYYVVRRFALGAGGLRYFGFASSLFDTFGCAMSLIAIIAFYLALNKNYRYLIYFALITVSGIINARTSMVLITAGVLIIVLYELLISRKATVYIRIFVFAVIAIVILGALVLYISDLDSMSESMSWLLSGLDSIKELLINRTYDTTYRGSYTNVFGVLFEQFIFFPDSLMSLIFGTGVVPNIAINKGSDIGYIQYIWKYGLIGSFIIYLLLFNILSKAQKKVKRNFGGLFIALGIMLYIFHFKSVGITYGMPCVILIPLAIFALNCNDDELFSSQIEYLMQKNRTRNIS